MPSAKQLAMMAAAGAAGFCLAWGGWTLVTDHLLLHTLAQIESQRQATARPALTAPMTQEKK